MTTKIEIKYNGRTSMEWEEILAGEIADTPKMEARVLAETKDMAKAAKKEDFRGIMLANRGVEHALKMLDKHHEFIKELEQIIKTAKRHEAGHKEILDFLDQVYEADLKWYQGLKEEYGGMSMRDLLQTDLNQTEILISRMAPHDAEKTFKQDLEARYNKLVKQIETKVGTIKSFDLDRNQNFSFDGFVFGEKGTAAISTIVAGGYNIQRAHYRTLVKLIK